VRIDIITLFPAMLEAPLGESILGRARARGLVDIRIHDLREHGIGRHRVTDEPPFGGGGGMILKPEPIAAAVESLRQPGAAPHVILLGPAGRRFTQAVARELARRAHLVLVCGRYEGVDERVGEQIVDEELSIGDYVLTGGEPAALVVADAVTRLLPGVLGDEAAPARDSFARGLLEHPQYTRPESFRGAAVPEVLRSGDHERIVRWRTLMSLWRTWRRRPDLLETADLTPQEQKWTDAFRQGRTPTDLLD
jgi:tRNA (guanine37-N1)-methyltransferase